METNNLSPSELVQAYLQQKDLVDSLTQQLDEAKTFRDEFESKIRRELIEPNEYNPLLIDGNILIQLVGGYLSVSRVTKI